MAATFITVTATIERADAEPRVRFVIFTPTAIVHDTDGNVLYTTEPIKVPVDAATGQLGITGDGVDLLATNSDGISPEAFQYKVRLDYTHPLRDPREWFIEVDKDEPGGTVDLADLAPASFVDASQTYVLRSEYQDLLDDMGETILPDTTGVPDGQVLAVKLGEPLGTEWSADIVHLTGAETITGVKTFDEIPVGIFPDLTGVADGEALLRNAAEPLGTEWSSDILHLAGAETVTGEKTFADTNSETGRFAASPWADVTHPDYGAVGDGTDATDAFVDAHTATTGGTVFVPDGEYLLDINTVELSNDNVALVLAPNAVITHPDAATGTHWLIKITGDGCSVRGGQIQGKRATDTGRVIGLRIEAASRCHVEGVYAEDFSWDGFYVTGSGGVNSNRVTFRDCHAYNNVRQGLSVAGGSYINVMGGSYSNSNGNAPQGGIDLEPSAGFTVDNVVIQGVVFSGNTGIGLQVLDAHNVTVTGCTATGNLGDADYKIVAASRVSLTGNTSSGATGAGFYVLDGATGTAPFDITITGNTIAAPTGRGIRVEEINGGQPTRIVISANVIRGGSSHGINAFSASGLTIIGNYIRGNALAGIDVANGAASESRDVTVVGNTVRDNGQRGIRVNRTTLAVIVGNIVTSNSTSSNAGFANIDTAGTGAAPATGYLISGNVVKAGGGVNKPSYGIVIGTNVTAQLGHNDVAGGGVTGNVLISGTVTDALFPAGIEIDGAFNHDGTTFGALGATPATQRAHVADADGTLADITTKFNTVLANLETFGFHATS